MPALSLGRATARTAAVLFALVGLTATAHGQPYIWNGTTSNDWGTDTNWDRGTPPGVGATVLFNSTFNLDTTLGATDFSLSTVRLTTVNAAVSIGGTGTLTLTGATGFDLSAAG